MAQIPFFLISQANTLLTTADLVQIYKLSAPTVVVASTNPTGSELTITDNHDGVFFIDAEPADFPTDVYFAKVNGTAQKEIAAVVFVNSDVPDHLNDATKHRLIDDAGVSATVLLSAEKIIALLGDKAEIDDAAGDGDDDVVYSANKIVEILASKADQTNIGDATFTYKHQVADDAAVNANIDALDKTIGNMDFASDPLLKSLIPMNPKFFNFTTLVKSLSNQVNNLKIAFTQGLEAFDRRLIFNDNMAAAVATGSEAAVLPIYIQSDDIPKVKRRGSFDKLAGDSYLYVSCLLYHIPPGSTPTDIACLQISIVWDSSVVMSQVIQSAAIEEAGRIEWGQSVYMDISALENKKYEVRLSLYLSGGAASTSAAMTEPNVEVTKTNG